MKTALITGASKRIGRAIASALAYEGYAIGVHYGKSYDDAEQFVAELNFMGVKAVSLQADLDDDRSTGALFTKAYKALGPIDLLVNNASVFEEDGSLSISAESFLHHQKTNLLAPLLLSKAYATQENLPEGASIINILDQRISRPTPDFLSYGLSKSGLFQATQALALSLAPKVRVNAVAPGPVLQSIHQNAHDFDQEAANTPLQRQVWPEEIAEAVLFLTKASSITGQTLFVDAGQNLR